MLIPLIPMCARCGIAVEPHTQEPNTRRCPTCREIRGTDRWPCLTDPLSAAVAVERRILEAEQAACRELLTACRNALMLLMHLGPDPIDDVVIPEAKRLLAQAIVNHEGPEGLPERCRSLAEAE